MSGKNLSYELFNELPQPLFIYLPDGTFRFINQAAVDLLQSLSPVPPENFFSLFKDQADRISRQHQALLQDEKLSAALSYEGVIDIDPTFLRYVTITIKRFSGSIEAPLFLSQLQVHEHHEENILEKKVFTEKYETVLETTSAMIWFTNRENRPIYSNLALRQFLGLDFSKIPTQQEFENLIHPDDRELAITQFNQAVIKKMPFRGEFRIKTAEGTFKWVLEEAAPQFDKQGVYLGYNGKFSNIHHLKYLQDSLKKTQLEVGLLIQDGESFVFQYNLDGSLSEISRSCTALLGYTPEEMQQIPLQQLIHPEDYEDNFNPQMFYRYVDNYRTLTVRLRTVQQTYKWFDIQGTFLLDEADEITGILFLARDVTERLRLSEKMELNNRFLENTESILVVTDKERRIEWVNASFTRISGYTQEEVIGKKPSAFLQGAGTDPAVVKFMHTKLEAGEVFECELLNYTKSGNPYWVHFRCEPLRNAQGEIEKYFAIEEDITERKERDLELTIAASFPKMNPNPILRISRSGEIVFQNEQASQLRDIVYEGNTYTLQELAQFIGSRITDRFVLPQVELNHNYFEMTCLAIPQTDFINIYCNNITALTYTTQRLQNNERKYRFLAENTKDLICLHNTQGQLIYTSPSSERLLGYRTEELQGRTLTDICHPEDQPALLSGIEKILSGQSELEMVQLRLKKRSAPYQWFEMQLYPVLEDQRISGAQSSSRDITPLKLQELRLKVNELKYRRLIDNIELGYLEVDNEGKVIYVNDAFCRMTKYEQAELMDQIPENILLPLPEQRSEMKQHNEARRQGIAEVYQLQIRRKDGVIRTWLISGAPLYNENGEIEGSAAIHWDISPMIEMEVMLHEKEVQRQRSILQASIRSEEKQKQTLGRELHDGLGQLLAYISLNMQLLLDKKIPPEQIVQQTKELLSNAITEVRQLSRTLIPVSLDNTKSLRDIITESLALYANLKGVRFEFLTYDERIDQRLDLDQKHIIFRIIQELTNNTIKYAEASLIQVSLQGRTRNCVIEYLDNGKGFSPRRVKKGVGFESIQTRIESYNGKLSIVSSPGKGVKITIAIPFVKTLKSVLKEEDGS